MNEISMYVCYIFLLPAFDYWKDVFTTYFFISLRILKAESFKAILSQNWVFCFCFMIILSIYMSIKDEAAVNSRGDYTVILAMQTWQRLEERFQGSTEDACFTKYSRPDQRLSWLPIDSRKIRCSWKHIPTVPHGDHTLTKSNTVKSFIFRRAPTYLLSKWIHAECSFRQQPNTYWT